jgi:hypothetical protein
MSLYSLHIATAVFWIQRNPTDPAQGLVSWDVVDTRTQAIVFSDADLGLAQADAVTRNQALTV